MTFRLEALRAEAGDCLLLHWGDAEEERLIVVDGGPSEESYRRLRRRLDALRRERGFADAGEPLPIELLMVSHIDDDHIDGILRLCRQLLDEGNDRSYEIATLWHNAFDDLIGNRADDLRTAARGAVAAASAGGDSFAQDLVRHDTALVVASVDQGRALRDDAARLGFPPRLLVAQADERPRNFGAGLELRLVGPLKAQVEALHAEWEERLRALDRQGRLGDAEAAAFTDRSAANLASLVVLAERDGRTMLLTGDARADFLVESLEGQGLLDADGRLHVDLFKLPHHGSSRNVDRSTFRQITADHYVVSGDGKHGNPDVATFELLFAGREDAGLAGEPFTFHLTYDPEDFRPHRGHPYPLAELRATLDAARQKGHDFTILHPAADEES
ncbi:MAG TPA: hypothetical protein VHM02_00215, partial [Thermoanaerobaculia bacterium]|nr:hypothetical protein [Thermoanaerobaculia bacterium]